MQREKESKKEQIIQERETILKGIRCVTVIPKEKKEKIRQENFLK